MSKNKLAINVFNKQNFTLVTKYFSGANAFVFCCDAKHSDILRGSSHVHFTCFGSDL